MNQPSTTQPALQLDDFTFTDLLQADGLARLDQRFLAFLEQTEPTIHKRLLAYRQAESQPAGGASQLIIDCAPLLERFLGKLFNIADALEGARLATLSHAPVFVFKNWYVIKQARQRLRKGEALASESTFAELDAWLDAERAQSNANDDKELAVARLGQSYLEDQVANADAIEKLIQWCALAQSTEEGQQATAGWVSFKLPQRHSPFERIPLEDAGDIAQSPQVGEHQQLPSAQQLPTEHWRHRDGFVLTDTRMNQRQVLSEIDYCVYCHDKDGDFCSKGFPQKKADPTQGLKLDPFGQMLTGCPVDEKISEMHLLKREGYTVAALATIMIDNPMCPATGHRICNDCMKACIYQKQDPVNIPEVETGVLTDVLKLPWGVEIYDLLTRWNPLRPQQWLAKPYNGFKILVMGMGPAGFSLAHHLLMEGFAVVGVDGLKIEPLNSNLLTQPIYDYQSLCESLDERVVNGFGGVAEYGITVRWDKNFLKLIYLNLLRRPYFQVFGGVRFGGTLTVEDAWVLGFDHLAVAVGAGLPKALPIPGSLAPGMRQANDFLMALQLTGAAKTNSLANLQVRLPAVVIGGGLTGVDTATEVQAYYLMQIEKMLSRYERLAEHLGEGKLRARFNENDVAVLDELLDHGRLLREERQRAADEGRKPDLIGLIRSWGGVTIVYRRTMQESPAYRGNHEELAKALEEGIYYREGLEPNRVILDEAGQVCEIVCAMRERDEEGRWKNTQETVTLPARAVLVATGAEPNIAYEFEHRGTFEKLGWQYKTFENTQEGLMEADRLIAPDAQRHCKSSPFGPFTSYAKQHHRVSFVGDTHPVFHGSVVKAIASGKRTYPAIAELFKDKKIDSPDLNTYQTFRDKMDNVFQAKVVDVNTWRWGDKSSETLTELIVKAPIATRNFEPGHFYRVQSFESMAASVDDTILQTEAMALVAAKVDKLEGTIHFIVHSVGASSRLVSTWKPGMPISVMGPTGVRNRIPTEPQSVVLISDSLGLPQVCALGPALREVGHTVLLVLSAGHLSKDARVMEWIESAADEMIIVPPLEDPVESLLHYSSDASNAGAIDLAKIKRVVVTGKQPFVQTFQSAFKGVLQSRFTAKPDIVGSVYGPMQCMLKGVCAQCLQWQIDPETGERTKAVYACSWQDQPISGVEFNNLKERLSQNRVQEILTNSWLSYLLNKDNRQ